MTHTSKKRTERKGTTQRVTRSVSRSLLNTGHLKLAGTQRRAPVHGSIDRKTIGRIARPGGVNGVVPKLETPAPQAPLAGAPGDGEHQLRVGAVGILYPLYSTKPVTKTFASGPQARKMDPSRLPAIDIFDIFTNVDPAGPLLIHRCLVVLGAHKFLVYGYAQEGAHINEALAAVRPTVVWRGEVVVFAVGHRVPILSRSRATRNITNQAVSRYLSGVSEAWDTNTAPPTKISMDMKA